MIRSRTRERHAQAEWDAEHEDVTPFAAVIGEGFDMKKLPATAKLLNNVLNDQGIAASTAKDFFRRKFPVTAEMPAVYREWSCDKDDRKPESRPLRSYPSGHSTLGYSLGVVLANLIPGKSQAILARAADYAYSREVCGDHYHSDVDASRMLGTAVGIMLLQSPAAQSQLEAARAELRAAHLTSN
jgi:acid phosphatase (class A)